MEFILNFLSEYLSKGDFIELFAANENINISLGFSSVHILYKITLKYRLQFFTKNFYSFFFLFLCQRQIWGPFLFHKVSAKVNPVFYSWKANFLCLTYV